MNALVGYQYRYGATIEAAESLLAQLDSQGKLTTLRRENRKILHKIEILIAN
jgi:menaquinone-dependent protoporphyrinogen IX oxidase